MCGIAGFLSERRPISGAEAAITVQRMADSVTHRGPDDAGSWVNPEAGIALGHRRLSVLDLSPAGHQPMQSACGRYVIAFNGEIYNHLDLRAELEKESTAPQWRGHSDTETLLAAFVRWGIKGALSRAIGMFALALWDRQERVLTLVRDRLGEKPLYYGWQGDVFLFGSELKALRAHPAFRAGVDRRSLCLLLRYSCIPAPWSIYEGIHKLPPGTWLTLAAGQREPRVEPYWSLRQAVEDGMKNPFTGGEHEAVAALESLLKDAVARQMVADVPLGAFLSGGVDSSTAVSLMQAQSARPVNTFSIGFHDAQYNEAQYAKAVAKHLGTAHTELYVTPTQAMEVIPRLPTLYDEPYADSSQIPTFLVAQLARRHVKVSISGDGADELFGGYNRYFWSRKIWSKISWMPRFARSLLARSLTAIPPEHLSAAYARVEHFLPGSPRVSLMGDKLHKLAERLQTVEDLDGLYYSLVSEWKRPSEVVRGGEEPATIVTTRADWPSLPESEHRMMFLDAMTYLPDDILVKVDRAAMGVSLETRTPYLDHRVVEMAWRLPMSMKIRAGQSKWALRQILYKYVPRHLIERPKQGFGIPLDAWLRGPLREWAETLLNSERLQGEGFFRPDPIRKKWEEHLSGRRNWQYHLWPVLMFQSWLESTR